MKKLLLILLILGMATTTWAVGFLGNGVNCNSWYAPTWTFGVTASNSPTAGAENIDAWSNNVGSPYETFSAAGPVITSAVNTAGYGACQKVLTVAVGEWYQAAISGFVLNSGTRPSFRDTNSGLNPPNNLLFSPPDGDSTTTFKITTGRSSYFIYYVGSGVATNFAVSGTSLKKLTPATLFASRYCASADTPVSAVWPAIAANTQHGVVARLDDPANPQKYILAYRDGGGNIKLDEIVAGVPTNLQSTAVAYNAASALKISLSGSTVQVFYGGVQVGVDKTTTVTTGNWFGIFSTNSGNQANSISFE